MNTTAEQYPVLETANGDLVLRVRGSTRDGQIVRLKSPKCTIGSGPRCTLRLHARGVRPMHCLIVRGSQCSVIRRWSPDTRLNGRSFADAELTDGDRLGIGPIELEVLDPGRLPTPDPAENLLVPLQQPPVLPSPGADSADSLVRDRLAARLAMANRQGRQRARRLLERLRLADQQLDRLRRLEDQRPELERQLEGLNQRAEALDARQRELDLERKAFQARCGERDAIAAKQDEALAQRGRQLDADRAESQAQRDGFERDRQDWDAERIRLQGQLDERAEALSVQWNDLELKREAFQRERREWEVTTAEAQRALSRREEQANADRAELETQREELQQQRRHWETQRAAAALQTPQDMNQEDLPADSRQPHPAPRREATSEEPVDIADVFRQMRSGEAASERREQEDASAEPPRQPSPIPAAGQSSPSSRPAGQPEEESIEDYMSRLMGRLRSLRGDEQGPDDPPPQSGPEPPGEPAPRQPAEASHARQPSEPQSAAPRERPEEMAPRAVAPERRANLSAMREVANISAQNAISRHAQHKMKLATRAKLLVVLIGLIVGSLLLWGWWSTRQGEVTLLAAVASFVVALYWVAQYARLARHKMLGKANSPEKTSGEDRSDADRAAQDAAQGAPPTASGADTQDPCKTDRG